ncbi:metal dependent phosphohydrolase [Magnetococcus marinus MC-1]|uniref:Metal dependent phosphohydrolase n=1 Tax=Magnetococcus marinus (strain ATCC BAA-1437 / JCM 17883 / MC-1) TaxID=156889 RepID=A0LAN3_MAGMM|nr:HD domain-containing phosphohydrolase [Magnetococcus marinus]ABK45026.1 metal dependent phosphohydrolase [Magnetococcus marinus MC-1]
MGEMPFNLNRYLLGLSFAIDCVERELLGVTTNHGKRVAYVTMRMARALGLSEAEVFDGAGLAILHDNGLAEERLSHSHSKPDRLYQVEDLPAHCEIGEHNVAAFPFQKEGSGVVRYHHECWDGSGFFGLQGDSIPLLAQIVGLADYTDLTCRFQEPNPNNWASVRAFVAQGQGTLFSAELVACFQQVSRTPAFWYDLQDPFIHAALNRQMPTLTVAMDWSRVLDISRVFSRIIDSKSRFTLRHTQGLEEKVGFMADYFQMPAEERVTLRIAASLHDVGKLAIPNTILDKPGPLNDDERRTMNTHTYYTRLCLEQIPGFEQITEWAANHHEKLDGEGYPLGLGPEDLDFKCRLMTVLDIYQALTEERPYRHALTHAESMAIIGKLRDGGGLDAGIVAEVDRALA